MSDLIAPSAAPTMRSKSVLYVHATATFPTARSMYDVRVGDPVCYDITVGVAVTTWDDYVRGRVVSPPLTANLGAFAGLIKNLGPRVNPSSAIDFSRWIDIVIPAKGDYVTVNYTGTPTAETTIIGPVNTAGVTTGSWVFGTTSTAIINLALAAEGAGVVAQTIAPLLIRFTR